MQRIIESVECALCHMPAERWVLRRSSDGYMYDCPACRGRYSIGHSALSRATKGEVPPDLLPRVRQHIATGDIPRIALTAGQWQPVGIVGRQDQDEAEN